ncbi:clotting factor B-like [Parasteatoda tepidariorum]|uniref:clotting factor B-like n=1 Tax=Parasteatoda tepidariorum TaxID=114398 RepID=UPI001C717C56|nr:clotting factor B-like [Parasteatoda tepidariorum]
MVNGVCYFSSNIHIISYTYFIYLFLRSLNPKLYSVQVGELQIGETIPYYEVEEVKTHEDYRPRYDYDDIAIMRLAQPLPSDIVPACLPTLDGIIAGDNVTILGWGDLSFGGPSSSILQEVQDIPVVGNSECDAKFRKIAKARFPRGIWNKFVCAGLEKGGKDACQVSQRRL